MFLLAANAEEEPGFSFPPDFFGPDDFTLTSKVEEVEATLQLLRDSMQKSKREHTGFREDLELVKEQVANVQKQMTATQMDIALTKEELMAAIAETNDVLTTQSNDINKLLRSTSSASADLAGIKVTSVSSRRSCSTGSSDNNGSSSSSSSSSSSTR